MKRLLPLLLLVACGAQPAPTFFGATRHEITLGGINFVVFHKDKYAEVVRLGYLRRAERVPVQGLMAQAAEQTTGCKVVAGSMITGLPGDTGEAKFRLTC
jgi:hypothetical protein